MKKLTRLIGFVVAAISICNLVYAADSNPSSTLWYDKPAHRWTDALPVGNGRLGAMVYGSVEQEIIQFNEDTLWSGQPTEYAQKDAHLLLPKLQQLLWDNNQDKAHRLANKGFMSTPIGQFSYSAFGNILLDFPNHQNVKNYTRKLDIEQAIASVSYDVDGSTFTREVIASAPDNTIVIYLQASGKSKLDFNLGLNSPHIHHQISVEGNEVILRGKANNYVNRKGKELTAYPPSKLKFEARVKVVIQGGKLSITENRIQVTGTNQATLYLVAATSFVNFDDISANPTERNLQALSALTGKSYATIKQNHLTDYSQLFDRVTLDLGRSSISKRPTDKRLISFTQDEDPSLVALLYQYGRYLLISSSRPGAQPANLQGIWNDKLNPPWDSKYTLNINTEMNYWLAEMTNLSELTEPLTAMIQDLAVTGKTIAKAHYNMPGWVTHHNTDIWRGAAPINNANHGIWPTGGAWLTQHLWWHYEYTNDKEFLESTAYPILKQASEFFVEYLVPDPNNPQWLVSGPSNSPEHGGLVMAPTMDHQIIRALFANTMEAASILMVDNDFVKTLKQKHAQIAPNVIGQHGQLQEWLVDKDDQTSKHRHVSHLWGLHPGNEIHPLTTPKLAEASKVTLLQRGDGGTGWSRAWKINFWARLLDGDHAFLLLKNLIVPSHTQGVSVKDKGGLYYNLFDAHPPFQIDGNFGVTSGVTEMILQSHLRDKNGAYFQDILPAIPSNLSTGKISGIKGRGAFEFTIKWMNKELVSLRVTSLQGKILNLRYKGELLSMPTKLGQTLIFKKADFEQ